MLGQVERGLTRVGMYVPGGTARFFSPLSTDSFLKKMSVIEYSAPCLETLARQTVALARSEGLDAHANSILVRFPDAGREEV